MNTLTIAVRLFCLLPFATGLGDLLLSAGIFGATGVRLPDEAVRNPALNSQVGFWGGIWFGFGLLLWKCSSNLVADRDWFYLLCGILVLSGVGRAIAAARFGLPSAPLIGAMALELVGAPLLVAWHWAVVRQQ